MKITVLVEDTPGTHGLEHEHGLSLYIETHTHKILFDMGQSSMFIRNAEKLGIDLSEVDTAIVSHGHYDHGGGLADFLKLNSKATIYIRRSAFGDYYSSSTGKLRYIGLDSALKSSEQIVLTDEKLLIDEDLYLFSEVCGKRLWSYANAPLYELQNGEYVPDSFGHEQNLVIIEDNKYCLISGCSHCSPVNIIDKISHYSNATPNVFIGGFHLSIKSEFTAENLDYIHELADVLSEHKTQYYTLHCTGVPAYNELKKTMADNLSYLSPGDSITI